MREPLRSCEREPEPRVLAPRERREPLRLVLERLGPERAPLQLAEEREQLARE